MPQALHVKSVTKFFFSYGKKSREKFSGFWNFAFIYLVIPPIWATGIVG